MEWKTNCYRVGTYSEAWDRVPSEADEAFNQFVAAARKRIEPWLSAVFQAEHLNLLLGSGFTSAVGHLASAKTAGMDKVSFGSEYDAQINSHADASGKRMGRGDANIEDQFRSALAVLDGLEVIDPPKAVTLKSLLDSQLLHFLKSILDTESGIALGGDDSARNAAEMALQSFLLSFASRAASRERLHVLTTNYDRLIEHGCDLAGLRVIDRFAGALNPVFRSTRVEVDMHYNPPGIRGEPRFMEGVIRLTKLHGSLDWHFEEASRQIRRKGIPFGADHNHTDIPKTPIDTVMVYPNPAKDVETTQYPYAELFRDFAASVCRPNAVVVTYGYGFGDDHINRVLLDMLTIPSTHLVIISWNSANAEADQRVRTFCEGTRDAQVSLLVGPHFADISALVQHYLPKPALDFISARMTELLKRRPADGATASGGTDADTGIPTT